MNGKRANSAKDLKQSSFTPFTYTPPDVPTLAQYAHVFEVENQDDDDMDHDQALGNGKGGEVRGSPGQNIIPGHKYDSGMKDAPEPVKVYKEISIVEYNARCNAKFGKYEKLRRWNSEDRDLNFEIQLAEDERLAKAPMKDEPEYPAWKDHDYSKSWPTGEDVFPENEVHVFVSYKRFIKLKNLSNVTQAFHVSTETEGIIRVNPVIGYIEPGKSQVIEVKSTSANFPKMTAKILLAFKEAAVEELKEDFFKEGARLQEAIIGV